MLCTTAYCRVALTFLFHVFSSFHRRLHDDTERKSRSKTGIALGIIGRPKIPALCRTFARKAVALGTSHLLKLPRTLDSCRFTRRNIAFSTCTKRQHQAFLRTASPLSGNLTKKIIQNTAHIPFPEAKYYLESPGKNYVNFVQFPEPWNELVCWLQFKSIRIVANTTRPSEQVFYFHSPFLPTNNSI